MIRLDLAPFLVSAFEVSKLKGGLLAVAVALGLILRYSRARKLTQLISDLNRVGSVEGGEISPEHEFDVIVAGGGNPSCFTTGVGFETECCRNSWMCACVPYI